MTKTGIFVLGFILFAIGGCSKKSSGNVPSKPVLSISNVQQSRNNSSPITFHFSVNLNQPSSQEIKVDYTTVDGTANGNDYTQASGTLTIPANQSNGGIDIEVKGDSTRDIPKTFYVQLSNPVNATLSAAGKGTGTINCDAVSYTHLTL